MPGRSTLTATSRRPSGPRHHGLVHLRDRGGGDRLGEAARTRASTGRPSVASTMARASAVGKGGISSFSRAERVGHSAADDVGPRGEELAELDVGRAEPVQRVGQAAAALGRVEAARLEQPRQTRTAPRAAPAGRPSATKPKAPGAGERRSRRGQPQRGAAPPSSELPAGMERRDAAGEVAIARRAQKPAARIMSAKRSWLGKVRIDSTR